MTHTYVILDVSNETFIEIARKLGDAGYNQAFHEHDGRQVIDMQGIALRAALDHESLKKHPPTNKAGTWNIGEPGGMNGPFYSVIAANGNIIAMQIPDRKVAELIASIPKLLEAGEQ